MDNRYIAEREGRDALRMLRHMRRVPRAGRFPAVYELALAFLRLIDNQVCEENIHIFLCEVRDSYGLSERELWGFVVFLKCALIARLSDVCSRIEVFLAHLGKSPDRNDFAAEDAVRRSHAQGIPPNPRLIERAERAQAAHDRNEKEISGVFLSLNRLSGIPMDEICTQVSAVENALMNDPAGIYPHMADQTKGFYRRRVSELAAKKRVSELEVAQRAVELAESGRDVKRRHVGYYLIQAPMGVQRTKRAGAVYIALLITLTALIVLSVSIGVGSVACFFLSVLPIWGVVKAVMDFWVIRLFTPDHIPRMDLENGIPEEGKTLCVISTLLTSPESGAKFAKLLEEYRLANRNAGPMLQFGILSGFKGLPGA